jgi:hypothetical protein
MRYLEIIRRFARDRETTRAQIGKALYAYDKVAMDKRWKRQFTLTLRRFTTPVVSADAKRDSADVNSMPSSDPQYE